MELAHKADTPQRSEEEQLAFFDAAMERCREAEGRSGVIVRHFDVAGTRVALSFAGPALVPHLAGALAHLAVEASEPPDVTLHVWDSQSTGIDIVPPPCARECFSDRGDIWGMSSARIKSAFHWIEFSLNLLDLERREGMYWVRSEEHLPYWTKASPLRSLFHWWMEANGAQLLHAAAVGTENGAILITGRGGMGKSTTALSALAAGMKYVADDYLVVRLDPEPRVFSLYSTAKLDTSQMRHFPSLAPMVANSPRGDNEKTVIQLMPNFSGRVVRSLPLRAVATPSFAGTRDTTVRLAPATGLQRAAAFTTMSQLPHAGRRTHEFIDRMIAALPGLELSLGTDLARIPPVIATLLAGDPAALAPASARSPGAGPRLRPLVSVIIPVYNGSAFLPGAVQSVLAQEYSALEIIVVDDGSTEDIEAVVRRLPVDVRYFRQENAGAASARNRGIRDASGDLLAFLDVDDLWPARNLGALVDMLTADPDADLVHGRAQVTRYEHAEEPGEYLGSPAEAFPYYIGAGVYRRRAFEAVGLFDPDLRFGEDTDWFTRAAEHGLRIRRLDEVTLYVRRHDGNMTRGKSLRELNQLRLFKKALERRRAQPPGSQDEPILHA